jgi:GAF domain-containing protein
MSDSWPEAKGDRNEVTQALAGLGQIVLGSSSLDDSLRQIAELAKDTIPDVDATSVTLMENDKARTIVFTSPLAVDLDERQYEDGFGPCLDAAVTGQTIMVDTRAPESSGYPEFAKVAFRAGVRHSLSVGLPINQRLIGGMNIYGSAEQPFSRPAVELAQTFAGYAAVAVSNLASYHGAADLVRQMRAAMESRSVIEQAKGIIMAERRCDADTAFRVLTQASQSQNLKLRRIAELLIARRITPST